MNVQTQKRTSPRVETVTKSEIETARRVLRIEAAGLVAMADTLDGGFGQAIEIIARLKGRVIVAGIGKSGHVARKVAATLASTGTPAFYVHPAEASHGDLGMVVADDGLIALSNSGETAELADLVAHAKRFGIPIVAVTRVPDSALARAADAVLLLPPVDEACPMGLAPTTSSTVMMALGDALAMALLERRGFSADDFHLLHPGGSLGRRLLKVSDIMHTGDELPVIAPEASMSEALLVMTAKSFGCIGVGDPEGQLLGIITDGDLRRHMAADLLTRSTRQVMTTAAKTIRPDALASEALLVMNTRAITNLFVVENGRAVGVLHVHDCLRTGVA
jgi:arabinose-5-phosphate isomerase